MVAAKQIFPSIIIILQSIQIITSTTYGELPNKDTSSVPLLITMYLRSISRTLGPIRDIACCTLFISPQIRKYANLCEKTRTPTGSYIAKLNIIFAGCRYFVSHTETNSCSSMKCNEIDKIFLLL